MLSNKNRDHFCSVNISSQTPDEQDYSENFGDTDKFGISLCHNKRNGSVNCTQLNDKYYPKNHIKPLAPCCLNVTYNASQYHFTWNSSYEEYLPSFYLYYDLMYQMQYYRKGENDHAKPLQLDKINFSLAETHLEPNTEYAVRVRSSPNQAYYMGEWSDWSPELQWKTKAAVHDEPPVTLDSSKKVLITLCVMAPIILILCYAPVKKWRKRDFIPTPTPYFQSLYSDCQGDFRKWVVIPENTADVLKAEETLQIDALSKCVDIQEDCSHQFNHDLVKKSYYVNTTDPASAPFPSSIYYVGSTSAPGNSTASSTLSSWPESVADTDSGCWLSSATSLDRNTPWYCNEYCTLSTFQKSSHKGYSVN
ncbi:interleukin-21 receptor [Thalassophryne amazonica]|uniref:interleukin-21 receptor n=1 Tax=Thalassophryne amazonica TaxID=390379 RepID=UPI001471E4BB|nr:interleukin-21 receptor [Thalassophryne amazonica]